VNDAPETQQEHGLLAPLRVADYARLWAAQSISTVGDKLYEIALAMLVYQRTGSMVQMGVVLAISALPAVCFGLLAGAAVDRSDRRMTMVASDALRAALVLLVALSAPYNLAATYVLAFLVGTVTLFFEPARLSLIPEIIPPDLLLRANSLDQISSSVAELVGLALGGAIVAVLGTTGAFAIDASTFVVSALVVWPLRYRSAIPPTEEAATAVRRVLDDLAEGLRYVAARPVLLDLMSVYTFVTFFGMGLITLLHLLALFTFSGGAATLAAFDTAITAGLLVGGYAVSKGSARPGRRFLFGVAWAGASCLALSVATTLPLAIGLLLVAGIANAWFLVPATTIAQTASEPGKRGRVFALRTTLSRAVGVLGYVCAGALAQQVGVRTALVVLGAALMATGFLGWLSKPLRQA
jgi:MFS family permease